jgi:hypothetical protein
MNQHQCRRLQRISRKKAQKAQKKNAFAFLAPLAVLSPNFIPCCEDFPRARRNPGQGNECQGNVGHSIDTHFPDKAVLANLGVLWVGRAAQPFGCGSAALCLFAAMKSLHGTERRRQKLIPIVSDGRIVASR